MTKIGMEVYVYRFNHVLPVNIDKKKIEHYSWIGDYAYHEVDLAFTFGAPFSKVNMVSTWYQGNYTDMDRLMSNRMMKLWTNMARSG